MFESFFIISIQIPLRTPQRPQPVGYPKQGLCTLYFCFHECTHFAWTIHTYVESSGSRTLLGSVVQRYSHNVILFVYTCMIFCCYGYTHFPWPNLTIPTHIHCAHTFFESAKILYIYTLVQSMFSFGMCSVNNCAVQLYNCTLASACLASAILLQNQFSDVR